MKRSSCNNQETAALLAKLFGVSSPPRHSQKSGFRLSFQSSMSATLPCEYEPTAILRKSPRMSNWTDCATTGAIASGRSLRQLTIRSEEHTSELQSRGHLVCRLLLEKKKT